MVKLFKCGLQEYSITQQQIVLAFQISPVYVQKDWYKKTMYASADTINNYIVDPLKATEVCLLHMRIMLVIVP